ncbi:MAG: N-formylglutamate amidohydrolase [Myxococcales bacterium]|nr:N-formylglutamate amidohydrolase [Myxococcales bacterium]
MRARAVSFVVSCEHARATVPARHRALLRGAPLETHRGLDLGSLAFARAMARRLGTELHATAVTRLLVDANRSARRPAVFSEWTRALPDEERAALLARFHAPHRAEVAAACERALGRGPMVHVAVHSFTPVLDGEVRALDVGLLYDPARPVERALAERWQGALVERAGLRVRRNQPYRGVTDGLPTALRRALGDRYVGFELELNQALWTGRRWPPGLEPAVTETLRACADALLLTT